MYCYKAASFALLQSSAVKPICVPKFACNVHPSINSEYSACIAWVIREKILYFFIRKQGTQVLKSPDHNLGYLASTLCNFSVLSGYTLDKYSWKGKKMQRLGSETLRQ